MQGQPIESFSNAIKLQKSFRKARLQQGLQKALAHRTDIVATVNAQLLKALSPSTRNLLPPCALRWQWIEPEGYGQLTLRCYEPKLTRNKEALTEFLNTVLSLTGVISVSIVEAGVGVLYQWNGTQWLKG